MIIFPMFLVFLSHIFSPHNTTHTHTPYHTHFSLFLVVFSVFPHAHSTQHTHSQTHTRTHTCTPATDRDLESGLSKSKTRKNPRNMPEKGKVRGISGEGSLAMLDRSNRSSAAKWRKTTANHLVAGSLRNFSHFFGKSARLEESGNMLFSTDSRTLNGKDPVLTSGEPLEQVITPLGPFMASRNLAMRDKPNIG